MNSGQRGFPNILQLIRGMALWVTGKPGATAGAGLAGGTTSGAPTSGVFLAGEVVVDQSGALWVCTAGGSPGTWVQVGSGGGGGIEITDGTNDVTGATKLTVTGGTVGGSTPNATLAISGGGSLSSASNYLGSDVSMTSANTWYDGPTVTLAAGTWLLMGVLTLSSGASRAGFTAKLWNGTTVYSSAENQAAFADTANLALPPVIVSPSGSTTYKISAASTSAGGKIYAAAQDNGVGNNASGLVAVKIG